jgi:hypothetical protein
MLAQNAAIQKLAKKDARISCSKNKEMMDSSIEIGAVSFILTSRLACPGFAHAANGVPLLSS